MHQPEIYIQNYHLVVKQTKIIINFRNLKYLNFKNRWWIKIYSKSDNLLNWIYSWWKVFAHKMKSIKNLKVKHHKLPQRIRRFFFSDAITQLLYNFNMIILLPSTHSLLSISCNLFQHHYSCAHTHHLYLCLPHVCNVHELLNQTTAPFLLTPY